MIWLFWLVDSRIGVRKLFVLFMNVSGSVFCCIVRNVFSV